VTDSSPTTGASEDNQPLLLASTSIALASLVPVALYQSRLIPALPDPSLRIFDSERITKSKTAHPLGIPDGWLGLASFGTTFVLVLLGRRSSTARKLLGVKLVMDASVGAFNAVRQIVEFRKLCSWCTATALSAATMAYAGRGSIAEAAYPELSLARQVRNHLLCGEVESSEANGTQKAGVAKTNRQRGNDHFPKTIAPPRLP